MTSSIPTTSIPLAAISVATSTLYLPDLKPPSASRRWLRERSECISATLYLISLIERVIFLALCLVRENKSIGPWYCVRSLQRSCNLESFLTTNNSWVTFSAAVPEGAISTLIGSFICLAAICIISFGIVAEKSMVCLSLGKKRKIF